MDRWFEVQRAKEAIRRLNVEIRRPVTEMHDEEAFVVAQVATLQATDPALALQIQSYAMG
jgi:hypothetical protein